MLKYNNTSINAEFHGTAGSFPKAEIWSPDVEWMKDKLKSSIALFGIESDGSSCTHLLNFL